MSKSFLDSEKAIMSEAIKLAKLGRGSTAPNPLVGAVVVSPLGEIIGRGFHPKAGQPHAEVFAISEAREKWGSLENATIYVTLEPCNHFGKTPPCVDLIVTSGIKRVIVGAIDPHSLMQGKSIEALRANGVVVDVGLLKNECDRLIRGFRSVMLEKRPFVTLKAATSLDGKIATSRGESQWITDEPARQLGHLERAEHDAILVGVGTMLADNPQLNVRINDQENLDTTVLSPVTPLGSAPLNAEFFQGAPSAKVNLHRGLTKVVLDSQLRTPPEAKIFSTAGRVIIYCDWTYPSARRARLEEVGATVVALSNAEAGFSPEGVNLREVLEDLAKRGVQELLIEGGARVLGTAVKERLFDRMVYFMAPRILGSASRDVFEGLEIESLSDSVDLENISTRFIGRDIVIEGTRLCSPV